MVWSPKCLLAPHPGDPGDDMQGAGGSIVDGGVGTTSGASEVDLVLDVELQGMVKLKKLNAVALPSTSCSSRPGVWRICWIDDNTRAPVRRDIRARTDRFTF